MSAGNMTQINYLARRSQDRLRLVEAENESLDSALELIEAYDCECSG